MTHEEFDEAVQELVSRIGQLLEGNEIGPSLMALHLVKRALQKKSRKSLHALKAFERRKHEHLDGRHW